ncbi:hypothetical protein [Bryobacter aggregatus]|uniref:hypothetical protein n=1 Tax=Bryobacter aggregatus TaxID=360054 RepID=UPI0004E26747|nr:hypothetical protein [Bryobacter aggregatus]
MKKILLVLILVAGLYWAFKSKDAPVPSSAPAVATPAKPVAGKTFNKLFPSSAEGFEVQFTQEKEGYAQADLLKNGKKLAQLSVSDTQANPSARDKFNNTTQKIAGQPAAAVGSMGTAILVAGRYQVQVRSLDPSFRANDREAWIAKFKLGDLQ